MSFDLNILVNGNRCKQYQHQGRTYVEARNGSEYVLEIKNNYWKRVLAVCSVDGLNVLTGKTATEKDTGYIVPAYSCEKIKGFRFSDDEWAMFKFGYKFNGKTYAQSKGGDAEKNCGVIGFRIFYETEPVVQYTTTWVPQTTVKWLTASYSCGSPPFASWSGTPQNTSINYCCSNLGQEQLYSSNLDMCADAGPLRSATAPTKGITAKMSKKRSSAGGQSADLSRGLCAMPEFDMGTEWGRREHSKVQTVQFDRGCLARSFEIYYASRDQLIQMGVPIHNVLNVPQAFPNAYATPPKHWNG